MADYKLSLPLLLEPQEVCYQVKSLAPDNPLLGSMSQGVCTSYEVTFVIQGSLALPYQTGY